MKIFVVALATLAVTICALPSGPNFQSCSTPVCRSGPFTGYGCSDGGSCRMLCVNGFCQPVPGQNPVVGGGGCGSGPCGSGLPPCGGGCYPQPGRRLLPIYPGSRRSPPVRPDQRPKPGCGCGDGKKDKQPVGKDKPKVQEKPKPQPSGPSMREEIVATMPNIPPKHANELNGMDVGFVQYIINNHQSLQEFVAKMNSSTLQYVIANVPGFEKHLAKMDAKVLYPIFDMIPNVAIYIGSIDPEAAQEIASKVPWLAKYLLVLPTTEPMTSTATAESTTEEETTVETNAPEATTPPSETEATSSETTTKPTEGVQTSAPKKQ